MEKGFWNDLVRLILAIICILVLLCIKEAIEFVGVVALVGVLYILIFGGKVSFRFDNPFTERDNNGDS
jgi:hypothetical protein